MTRLSPAEIAQYAHEAGFRGDGLVTAVAVALAESGGGTKQHNDVSPDDSYGLWQINMLGAMGPERREQFGLERDAELFRPAENAKAAYAISNHGKDFDPWTTYSSGSYRQYLDEARRGAKAVDDDGGRLKGMHKHDKDGKQHGPSGAMSVDLDALSVFTQRTGALAENLRAIARTRLGQVRTGQDHAAFGAIGKESGFSNALNTFGDAIRHQTFSMAYNASTFAKRTRLVGDAYRDHEQQSKRAFDQAVDRGHAGAPSRGND